MPQTRAHSLQDKRLRSLMQQISKMNASLPNGLPQDVESPAGKDAAAAAKNVVVVADDLARTALEIPNVVKDAPLSEADRRAFDATAQTLHDQAIRLRDEAQRFQVEKMQRTMDGIASTCISCHSRFREFSGDLDFRKASLPQDDASYRLSAVKAR